MRLLGAAITFTVLALFLGDSVLAFLSDQLDRRRTFRLELAREQTRRAEIERDRVALIWHGLEHDQQPTDHANHDRARRRSGRAAAWGANQTRCVQVGCLEETP